MMNGAQYVESLKQRKPRVFYRGERLAAPYDHPAIAPHVKTVSMTYELARSHPDVMTATSHLTGGKVLKAQLKQAWVQGQEKTR